MFIHSECNSSLYLDISNGVKFFTAFGVDKTGLKPYHGELKVLSKEIESNFYCINCERSVNHNEVMARCMYCGFTGCIEEHDFYILSKSGGVYCGNCCNNYYSDESRTALVKAFKKIRF